MANRLDGGSAFPNASSDMSIRGPGMSLRDYFAGQALIAIASYMDVHAPDKGAADRAARCYAMADAMLAEREKHAPPDEVSVDLKGDSRWLRGVREG